MLTTRLRVLVLGMCVGFSALGTSAQVPSRLDILSATIEEQPPIDSGTVPNRVVLLRIELAGSVPSPCGPAFQEYGFLIDRDRDPTTGITDPAFEDLGVDAKVAATCNIVSGVFEGPSGSTVTITGPTLNVIEIRTTVQRLPSLEFSWVAFAQEESLFTRLPESPSHGGWATHEISLF